MKPEYEKLVAIVKAAGLCWHTGIHPLYKSTCVECGESFTNTLQKPHPDPNDLNDLMELAIKLRLLVRITTVIPEYDEIAYDVQVKRFNRNVWLGYGTQPTAAESLLNALYGFIKGE